MSLKVIRDSLVTRIIVAVIAPIIFFSAFYTLSKDSNPEVTTLAEKQRPGYEPIEAVVKVSASPAQKIDQMNAGEWFLLVVGFVLAGPGVFVVLTYGEAQLLKIKWYVLSFLWLAGFLMVFGTYLRRSSSHAYYKEIPKTVYDTIGDPDALFPRY